MDHHDGATDLDVVPPLVKAAQDGDASECARLLRAGADVNARHPGASSTPLMLAAAGGHTHVCELLLQHGAYVNAANAIGRTALLNAITAPGGEAVCELLLAHGADVDARIAERAGEKSPLWIVASLGDERLCMLMIDKSQDVDAVRFRGQTVLHQAAGQCLLGACGKLVERGADVNVLDVFGTTPLGRALEHHVLYHPANFNIHDRVASPPPDQLCVAVCAAILRSRRVDVKSACNRQILAWLPRSMVVDAFNDEAWARRRAVLFRRVRRA